MSMRLFYEFDSDGATLTPSTENTNFPAENVKSIHTAEVWRTTSGTDQYLDFDMGSQVDVNALGIVSGEKVKGVTEGQLSDSASITLNGNAGFPALCNAAYTNLVTDPTDLTTANWTKSTVSVTDSGETIKGFTLYNVTLTANTGQVYVQGANFTLPTDGTYVSSIVLKRGSVGDRANFGIFDFTASTLRSRCAVTFSTKSVSASIGSIIDSEWIDDDTVIVQLLSTTCTAANTNRFQIFGELLGDNFLTALPQATLGETRYPFVDGTRAANAYSYSYPLSQKGTAVVKLHPHFSFTATGGLARIVEWSISSTQRLVLLFVQSVDKFFILVQDGGTLQQPSVNIQFDDGTSFQNINQDLTLILSWDYANTSVKLRVTTEYGTTALGQTTTADPLVSTMPTLYIGQGRTGIDYAESSISSVRIYEGIYTDSLSDVASLTPDFEHYPDPTYADYIVTGTDLDENPGFTRAITATGKRSIYETFTRIPGSEYRLKLSDTTLSTIRIGRIGLGTYLETTSIRPNPQLSLNEDTIRQISNGGQVYGSRGLQYRTYRTSIPKLTKAQKEEYEEMFAYVANVIPFFIDLFKCVGGDPPNYVIIDQEGLTFSYTGGDFWTLGLDFREVF